MPAIPSSNEPVGSDSAILQKLDRHPSLSRLANEIFSQAGRAADVESLLAAALPAVLAAAGGDYLALAAADGGRWTISHESGSPKSLPVELLGDVLDREETSSQDAWIVAPLDGEGATVRALALHVDHLAGHPQAALIILKNIAPLLDEQISLLSTRCRETSQCHKRLQRLEMILQFSRRWNRSREIEPLLVEMAAAAARLLAADRASIFLWDKPNRTLVGRPALGVEGNELRIADDSGIVGQVIHSGKPLRADVDVDATLIDKQTDDLLGYQTRTLLCVPLRDASGELIGAFELINKISGSFSEDDEAALCELAAQAAIILQAAQDRRQLTCDSRQIAAQAAQGVQLVGQSPKIEATRSIVQRVAGTDLAVLILGENGTGKEVVAQSIHYLSNRRERPFIAVNCAAIPDTLAESELFGHEKGAFTDAREQRAGKFELAASGTLFLDEIAELSPAVQSKLLRVLESQAFTRVGGSTPMHSDARLLAATNQDLAAMVREKRFREDLYFRLNVVTVELPPLRDRGNDIPLLAEFFLRSFCQKAHRPLPELTAAARQRLMSHGWPGNVRELRNLMERLAFLSSGDCIGPEELSFTLSPHSSAPSDDAAATMPIGGSLAEATANFQIQHIASAIDAAGGNISRAASRLGLHRSNLYRKMRQLKMDIDSY